MSIGRFLTLLTSINKVNTEMSPKSGLQAMLDQQTNAIRAYNQGKKK